MKVTLAVRPTIQTVVSCGPWHYYPHWTGYSWHKALAWLGDKYLCYQPIKRKIEHA